MMKEPENRDKPWGPYGPGPDGLRLRDSPQTIESWTANTDNAHVVVAPLRLPGCPPDASERDLIRAAILRVEANPMVLRIETMGLAPGGDGLKMRVWTDDDRLYGPADASEVKDVAEKHRRLFLTDRQRSILDAPSPEVNCPEPVWREWYDMHDNFTEEVAEFVTRMDPPNMWDCYFSLDPKRRLSIEDIKARATRFEDWCVHDLRPWGGPVLGWPTDQRPESYWYQHRFVENDRETPEIIVHIEAELRATGATEPSDWLLEMLEIPEMERKWG